MAEVDVVVFDLGGVPLDWDRGHLYRRLVPDEAERRGSSTRSCRGTELAALGVVPHGTV